MRCSIDTTAVQSVPGHWDRLRIDQILTNLLSNACKFGAGRPIEVEVSASDGMARIRVRDHGIGIAPEDQRRIFERFERGSRDTDDRNGLGLGLFIARQIMEEQNGKIWVESEPNCGSTFSFELPLS